MKRTQASLPSLASALIAYSFITAGIFAGMGCGETPNTRPSQQGDESVLNSNHSKINRTSTGPNQGQEANQEKTTLEVAQKTEQDRTAKAEFTEKVTEFITALQLPFNAIFEKPTFAPSAPASIFVELRCGSMLKKMQAAPKSATNLYDDVEMRDACSGTKLTYVPGLYIEKESIEQGWLSDDSASLQVALRPDFTVSGFKSTLVLGKSRSEKTSVISKTRKIESTKNQGLETLEVTDLKGRFDFKVSHEIGRTFRDGRTTTTLVYRKLRANRTLEVSEIQIEPAQAIFGNQRVATTTCLIQMKSEDGSNYAESRTDRSCFNRWSLGRFAFQ